MARIGGDSITFKSYKEKNEWFDNTVIPELNRWFGYVMKLNNFLFTYESTEPAEIISEKHMKSLLANCKINGRVKFEDSEGNIKMKSWIFQSSG
jgi:hypothetical protein